jgi:ankyrin repeat protein
MTSLALQIISPLDYRIDNYGAIGWAAENNKILAIASLLQASRVYPAYSYTHAIRVACRNGHKEIVELLLQDPRVNPADDHCPIRFASAYGHKEIVELLLQGMICKM